MITCSNCGVQMEKMGQDQSGLPICCAHCVFNPLGCRCRFGEFGVAQEPGPWMMEDDQDFYGMYSDCFSEGPFGEEEEDEDGD